MPKYILIVVHIVQNMKIQRIDSSDQVTITQCNWINKKNEKMKNNYTNENKINY